MSHNYFKALRLWPNSTVLLIGGGPSLCVEDVRYCKERHEKGLIRCIGINDAYRIAPWIDILYAADKMWWKNHTGKCYEGLKIGIEPGVNSFGNIKLMKNCGSKGLERDNEGLRTGSNSGYQAINLAYHMGAKRILLIGYDMKYIKGKGSHWFGNHEWRTEKVPVEEFLPYFSELKKELDKEGIEVINITRDTNLNCFVKGDLRKVLL